MTIISKLKNVVCNTPYTHNGTCGIGSAYPARSKENCDKPAVVRFRVSGKWHYCCNEHSGWPMWDRSEWLQDMYDVQRWTGDGWEEWTDFEINTPQEHRSFNDNGDWIYGR